MALRDRMSWRRVLTTLAVAGSLVIVAYGLHQRYSYHGRVQRLLRQMGDQSRIGGGEVFTEIHGLIMESHETFVAELAVALKTPDSVYEVWHPKLANRLPKQVVSWLPAPVPSTSIRRMAAAMLGASADKARPAVPALIDLSRSTNRIEQSTAINVLMALATIAPEVQPRLLELMRTANDSHKMPLAQLLDHLNPGLPEARRVLQAGLSHQDPSVRRTALGLFPEDEAGLQILLPVLARCLKSEDATEVMAAVSKLKIIAMGNADARTKTLAVSNLVVALKYPHVWVRSDAAQALAALGAGARVATPVLAAMLKDGDPQTRMIAATALLEIDPGVKGVRAVFTDYLEDTDDELRAAARSGLAALDGRKTSPVPSKKPAPVVLPPLLPPPP